MVPGAAGFKIGYLRITEADLEVRQITAWKSKTVIIF